MNQNDLPPFRIESENEVIFLDSETVRLDSKLIVMPALKAGQPDRKIQVMIAQPSYAPQNFQLRFEQQEFLLEEVGQIENIVELESVTVYDLNRAQLWALSEAIQALLCEHPCTLDKG